jgi:hypothetical protein
LNNHKLELSDEDFFKLIRHHKIATVSYSDDKDATTGLESHDIYIIDQPEVVEEDSQTESHE